MGNIQLQDSVVAALTAQAQAEGMSLEAYLEHLTASTHAVEVPQLTGEELLRLLDEASVNGSAAESAYSRADIYLDHN